jgi:GT2 family glycosyltransferase
MESSLQNGTHKTVAVVIVHWNQPGRCLRTVESFARQSIPVDLLVVDNDSTSQALVELEANLPGIPIHRLRRNAGFGPTANVGLRHWLEKSDYEYLVVAPHDALVEPECLQRMVTLLEARPAIGLASADLRDGATPRVDPYLGGITVPARVVEGWEPADYPHGTLMMGRRSCLMEVGLFDERYFAYGEEIDLGMRARAAGWEVGLVRGAGVLNPTTRVGTAALDYLQHRNTLMLIREYSGTYHAFMRFNIALVGLIRGLVFPSSRPPVFSARARVRGMLDFIRGRHGAPPDGFFERLDRHGEPVRS